MVEREFERDLPTLARVFDFVAAFLAGNRVGEEAAYAVNLAVEELFTNAVKFSSGSREPIRLGLAAENTRIVVRFCDSGGEPFDITRAEPVELDRPASEIRPGGLGIHLVRSLMDDVAYSYRDNANVITLVKYLEHKDAGDILD